jgi:hypothetical protein
MDESPSRSNGFLARVGEILGRPWMPVVFTALLLLEALVALPFAGRCNCCFRSWLGVAIMTDAGPRVIAYPSVEWEEAEKSGAAAAPLATGRVFPIRRGGLGLTTRRGISFVYAPTPGSGWDTPLMQRAFREGLADALERENIAVDTDTRERLRSGIRSNVSINIPGIIGMLFVATPPVGLALSVPLAIKAAAARRAALKGFCTHCGYDARGLPACPECGHAATVNNEA